MQTITDLQELAAQCNSWHMAGEKVVLVPTMGYYHAGHEALMDMGKSLGSRLVVSLFVNPAQFGPGEDLEAYPRDPVRDAAIAEKHGVDLLFMPDAAAMYAPDHGTWVEVPEMGRVLCGQQRPIHFRGVCTVVLKLFCLTRADVAVFGQKDWQQQAILRRMVRDLNLQIRLETCPTVREPDGLALSSRNVYLASDERGQAPQIRAALLRARELAQGGETRASVLRDAVLRMWAANLPLGRLDYLTIVHPETLVQLDRVEGPALMACAVRMGKARLIDNIILRD